jgi:hypothetical protein
VLGGNAARQSAMGRSLARLRIATTEPEVRISTFFASNLLMSQSFLLFGSAQSIFYDCVGSYARGSLFSEVREEDGRLRRGLFRTLSALRVGVVRMQTVLAR